MKNEVRRVCRDRDLGLEACRFQGVMQPFPNHFHDYYVIGLVEAGSRSMICKNREYTIGAGDMVLFQPGDNHGCAQCDGGTLDYRALNIPEETMRTWTKEAVGDGRLPGFTVPVIHDECLSGCFRRLHRLVLEGSGDFEKEELLLRLLAGLWERYGGRESQGDSSCRQEVERACAYMEAHYTEHITLEDLCRCSGLSKSTLLRAFTGARGVTPYRYLQAVRVNQARGLLEKGAAPAEAAVETGFSD